ncbi:hypothetical protein [Alienimonas chondri]|uniref:Uncharacterized protein n=1 Tax=Alienimonas chondri TaxID=2681879 RepID=A0ABX1VCP9_9PLAN|nr:hypothetical protein [Alienimonas chondri]NNJ25088.1 hypothetical protein [Alienimonas chondri]
MSNPDSRRTAPGPGAPAIGPRYGPTSVTRRAALTTGAAAGLTGLYLAYAATVTPLLESARMKADTEAEGREKGILAPKSNKELAQRYLPHAPFAEEAKYQIGSGNSMMYWNEWEIVERGEKSALQVSPFAMVVVDDAGLDPETGGKPPTTVTAGKALLRFESNISEEMVSSPGRVVNGVFQGAVRVDGEGGLQIVGSNFQYWEGDPTNKFSILLSDYPVDFRHGGSNHIDGDGERIARGHEGHGKGVEVKLFRTRTPGSYDNIAADGLAEVAVRGPVALTLQSGSGLPGLDAAGGPLADADAEAVEDVNQDEPRQPVHITATGRLVFDPHANTALFTAIEPEGVRAWRDQPAGTVPPSPDRAGPDELIADDLLVMFSPATPEAREEAAAMRAARENRNWDDRGFYAADDDLEATAVIANGAPVRVNSPARQVQTTSARLEHDVRKDVLTLIGRTDGDRPQPATGVQPAVFRQAARLRPELGDVVRVMLPDSVIDCPRLVVMPPEIPAGVDPKSVDAPRRINALGPGTLRRTDPETGEPAALVKWPGTLTTQRDAGNGRDVVILTGPKRPQRDANGHTALADQVIVQTFAEGSDLAADHIVLELEKNPDADNQPPSDANGSAPPENDGALAGADPMGGKMRPAKAIATGSVRMKGPELLAGAKSVHVDFVDPPPLPPKPPGDAVADAGGAGGPGAATPAEPTPEPEKEEPKQPGPLSKFYADDIVATLVRARTDERGVEVQEGYVSHGVATGQVGLFQDAAPPTEPGGKGRDRRYAKASRMVVTGAGPGEQLLTMFGKEATEDSPAIPAELEGSGSDLTGPEIRFDPQKNTAVVVGAGWLNLPVKGGGMPGFAGASEPDPAAQLSADEEDPDLPSRKSVRVDWRESMTFDGSVATFYGGARTLFHGIEGEVGSPQYTEDTVSLYCKLMTVTLTEKVVFGSSLPGAERSPSERGPGDKKANEAEIKLITCHGRVNVRGRQDAPDPRQANPKERLVPREAQRVEASFAQLEVLWKTGDFTAQGEGDMKVWRRDDKTAPAPAGNATVRPNAGRQRSIALPCELIHVVFKRDVRGNLNGPDAIFHPNADGDVEVTHGPVRDFGVPLLTGPAVSLPAGASRMKSRRLELRHVAAANADEPKTRELFASVNVEIEGHGESNDGKPGAWYWANAPQATYNEAKDRLQLNGNADGLVQLYRAATETGPRTLATSRTIVYFPETNKVDVKGVQDLDGLP